MLGLTLLAILPAALAVPAAPAYKAPIVEPQGVQIVPDRYIVKMRDSTSKDKIRAAVKEVGEDKVQHIYDGSFKGFASKIAADQLSAIQSNVEVEYVEKVARVGIDSFVTQTNSTWGLGRISHKAKGSTNYIYDDSAGAGVCIYVIDTGIYTDHEEFEGRATWLFNSADDEDFDGHGHGTHTAGTAASRAYGVAKKASLFAVKVLDSTGFGTTDGVIAGMDFVATDAATRDCPNGAVANMSLGGGKSDALNAAAKALVDSGVFLAVSAGNSNTDASSQSPASEPSACTVGSTTSNDERSSFSNYGSGVDVWAPGSSVLSSYIGAPDAWAIMSGTSMASPHVAGLAAYLMTLTGKKGPQEMCSYIAQTGVAGALTGVPSGTANVVVFNGSPSS